MTQRHGGLPRACRDSGRQIRIFLAQTRPRTVIRGMRGLKVLLIALAAGASGWPVAGHGQSLAEAARREAARRKELERRGIKAKLIEAADPALIAPNGTLSTSKPAPAGAPLGSGEPSGRKSESLGSFRTKLEKLDREISRSDNRLRLLRSRLEAERRASDGLRRGSTPASLERLRQQIGELTLRLKQLREERSDTYRAGRRAGFLPGELEDRGIIP